MTRAILTVLPIATALALAAAGTACEREAVVVGASGDQGPGPTPTAPMFTIADAARDDADAVVIVGCTEQTPLKQLCPNCPNGYVIGDGGTCDCCP